MEEYYTDKIEVGGSNPSLVTARVVESIQTTI